MHSDMRNTIQIKDGNGKIINVPVDDYMMRPMPPGYSTPLHARMEIDHPPPKDLNSYIQEMKEKEAAEKYWAEKEKAYQEAQKPMYPESKETNPKDAIGSDKLPMHLVSGVVKAYQAIAHFLGNVKYGAWNYRAKGARASVYRAALDRHMDAWWEGEEDDQDDGTPHLANALACINILIEAKEAGKLVDDRPPKSNYREVMNRLTPLVKKIKEKHGHMNPVHYSINKPE